MIAIVWQFDVRPGKNAVFEELYGANGAWTAMNRRSRSYLGSSFLHDQNVSSRYVIVEYWSEMLVYERHQADFSDEVNELVARRGELVASSEPLGLFTALDVPERAGPTWSRRG